MDDIITIKQHSTVLYNSLFDSKYEIGVRLQDFNTSFNEHYHNYIEIVCQLNSSSIQIVNGKEHHLNARDMIIIQPGDSHQNIATKSTVLNLIVSEKFLTNLVIDSTFDDNIIQIKNVVASKHENSIYQMPETTWNIVQDIYFLMLNQLDISMYYLRQKLNITAFFISLEDVTGIMDVKVNTNKFDLINYIESDIKNASLNDLSKQYNYSPSLISQRIKSQYEMTFVEILQEIRLKHAIRLLTSTNLNIDQIIDQIGYNNKTHFYNLFKEKYNHTPNSYRKLYSK